MYIIHFENSEFGSSLLGTCEVLQAGKTEYMDYTDDVELHCLCIYDSNWNENITLLTVLSNRWSTET